MPEKNDISQYYTNAHILIQLRMVSQDIYGDSPGRVAGPLQSLMRQESDGGEGDPTADPALKARRAHIRDLTRRAMMGFD